MKPDLQHQSCCSTPGSLFQQSQNELSINLKYALPIHVGLFLLLMSMVFLFAHISWTKLFRYSLVYVPLRITRICTIVFLSATTS